MTGELTFSTSKESNDATHHSYINYRIHISAMFNLLHMTNLELFEKAPLFSMKNTDNFHYAKEAITCYHQELII